MSDTTKAAADAVRALRHAGLDAGREFAWRTYFSVRGSTEPDPVLEADWDLLVVLDACRADLFAETLAEGEYEGLQAGETRVSPGSSSREWLASVFGEADDEALANLAYVTGNPYSARVLDAERFGTVAEVWREAWDDDRGTIPPEPITDRAVALGREGEHDRLVVHYMQPHFPSIAETGASDGVALSRFGEEPMSVWEELRFGRLDEATVWERYRANLEYVLEEVESLLANVDADRAVVTADHGNAVGEYHIYGHPGGVDLPCLREVPWCETTATDRGTRDPLEEAAGSTDVSRTDDDPAPGEGHSAADEDEPKTTVEDRLEQLGYRT